MRRYWMPLGMLLVAAALAAPGRVYAGLDGCSGCTLLGSLSVRLVSVEPAQPLVGETVSITFAVDARVPGGVRCDLGDCGFLGGEPYLEGTDPLTPTEAGLVVRRRVVQAGTTTVELHVRTMTEEQCYYEDPVSGCQSFFEYAFIEASSGPVELQLLDPTPTPTATARPTSTPSPSATARRGDGGGCTVGDRPRIGPIGMAGGLALLIVIARVRRRRGAP